LLHHHLSAGLLVLLQDWHSYVGAWYWTDRTHPIP
jgi:hypothetical protein